jgi:four helix bundle protein
MQNFNDLKVWEKAHLFTLKVYEASKIFPKDEMYSLTNQLRRAASSIPANIAEGCGKNSQREFAQFLNVALGSANESEYFLILAKDLHHLTNEKFLELTNSINEIKAMLISMIGKVRSEIKT